MCKCGCRGWCTLWVFLWVIQWDLNNGACGRFALARHDLSSFDEVTDIIRRGRTVGELGIFICIVEFRGDWPAMTDGLAVRTWAHKYHPCLFCRIPKSLLTTLRAISGFSLDTCPFEEWSDQDHRDEVARCKIVVHIPTPEIKSTIWRALRYLKRSFGRSLAFDLPTLVPPLQRFDRLEPTEALPNVADFETQPVPFSVLFWRMNVKEDRVLHDSPLLKVEGVGFQSAAIDILHSLHLGAYPTYIGYSLEMILNLRSFAGNFMGFLDADDVRRVNLGHIKSLVQTYYARKRATDPNWNKRGSEVFQLNSSYTSLNLFYTSEPQQVATSTRQTCAQMANTLQILLVSLQK
jgi:hypothetical protein